jgi:ribosomal protein L29
MPSKPNKKMAELAGKSLTDLRASEKGMRKELFDLQFQRSTKGLEDKASVEKSKRAIARNLTRQSQLAAAGNK